MINDAFLFSCKPPTIAPLNNYRTYWNFSLILHTADDDSDTSPHDLEGGNVDLEYGTAVLNMHNHQSFTQMQVGFNSTLDRMKSRYHFIWKSRSH